MKKLSNKKKSKNKKFKKINSKKNKSDIKRKLVLNRIKVTVICNPVQKAIIDYNKGKSKNYINCLTDCETIERITLNYIRHRLTNYELEISRLGLCPKRNDLFQFKKDTNKYITSRYGNDFISKEIKELKEIRNLCST